MRPMLIIGGSIAALVLAGMVAWPQFSPTQQPHDGAKVVLGDEATIAVPEAVVRSGPNDTFYQTGTLRAGEKVRLITSGVKVNEGWLAIVPPTGSTSLIKTSAVQQAGLAYIVTQPVSVMPGSPTPNVTPNVETVTLAAGTQVEVVGKEVLIANVFWWPIKAPAGDVRYIPKEAIGTSSAQTAGGSGGTGFFAPAGGNQSPLARGDAARQQAIAAYQQASQSGDPTQKAQADYWLHIMQPSQTGTGPTTQPGFPYNSGTAVTVKGPGVSLGGTPAITTGTSTAMYATPTSPTTAKWTDWGTLKKTPYQKDGQAMYRLEGRDGDSLGYAIAAPGLTLEPYVGQVVCLFGTVAYRSDDSSLRGYYTIVSSLSQAPKR